MNPLVIAEIPSKIWNFPPYFNIAVDRSGMTVSDYLKLRNIIWKFGDDPSADARVYKEENLSNGLLTVRRLKNEFQKRFEKKPYINLNGEAQENSKIAYFLADPDKTLSVAPGQKFRRLYFPSLWSDPHVETWNQRLDKICWIGRPLPERIRLAKKIESMGIDIDIYSKEPWPSKSWKGYAVDEIETSQKYKYRIVFENSLKNLYHSEKLFNGIRSGCVTFYLADPELELSHLTGSYLPLSCDNLINREELSQQLLIKLRKIMFSEDWEIYSFKCFFDRIIDFLIIGEK
ncbi:MAG TPA: hypothetical protein VMW95_01855 [Desulfobacterales bacterium]|nr:hypothetical protein [Desulfobacterales bacterium]